MGYTSKQESYYASKQVHVNKTRYKREDMSFRCPLLQLMSNNDNVWKFKVHIMATPKGEHDTIPNNSGVYQD
jgi:hypothetical protein